MVQMIAILLSSAAVVTALFSATAAWVVLGVPTAFLLVTLAGLKQKHWKHVPELSATANTLLQKYGHFYAMPFAGRDFSASASTLMFAGCAVALVGVFKGYWWGLAIAIANWFAMGLVSKAFNPTHFIAHPLERLAHEEVISFLVAKDMAIAEEGFSYPQSQSSPSLSGVPQRGDKGPGLTCPRCQVPVTPARPLCPKCGVRVRLSRPA